MIVHTMRAAFAARGCCLSSFGLGFLMATPVEA